MILILGWILVTGSMLAFVALVICCFGLGLDPFGKVNPFAFVLAGLIIGAPIVFVFNPHESVLPHSLTQQWWAGKL